MKSIYIAGPYPRRAELERYARQLETMGYKVTSRWLNEIEEAQADATIGKDGLNPSAMELNDKISRNDIADLMAADIVVSFTMGEGADPRYTRGGRHVEFGIALAWDKALIIVGRRETVFHYLTDVVQVDDWPQALTTLAFVAAVVNQPLPVTA